jgi:tRNA (cytidine/uridine-2'-O-)-methyltransferase
MLCAQPGSLSLTLAPHTPDALPLHPAPAHAAGVPRRDCQRGPAGVRTFGVFFRSKKPPEAPTTDLSAVVARCLPDADEDTVSIVTAVAGLLGCICYADREVSDREGQMVRNLLQTVDGIGPKEADAILSAIAHNIITISTTQVTRYARTLKSLGDDDLRRHVLDMMLDVATVDSHLSTEEVVVLRQVTQSLGLGQAEYNALQHKHRNILSTLQAGPIDVVLLASSDDAAHAEPPRTELRSPEVSTPLVDPTAGADHRAAVEPSALRLRSPALAVPFHIVLVEPEIPPNTGNIARLCAATNSPLHLVGKLGFSIDEHAVRRAGLDYWHLVQVHTHAALSDAEAAIREHGALGGSGRTWLLTGRSTRSVYDVCFSPGDTFVFGKESVGLPHDLLDARPEQCLAVPTLGGVRSLNLANSVSIVLFEALRQIGAFQHTQLG